MHAYHGRANRRLLKHDLARLHRARLASASRKSHTGKRQSERQREGEIKSGISRINGAMRYRALNEPSFVHENYIDGYEDMLPATFIHSTFIPSRRADCEDGFMTPKKSVVRLRSRDVAQFFLMAGLSFDGKLTRLGDPSGFPCEDWASTNNNCRCIESVPCSRHAVLLGSGRASRTDEFLLAHSFTVESQALCPFSHPDYTFAPNTVTFSWAREENHFFFSEAYGGARGGPVVTVAFRRG